MEYLPVDELGQREQPVVVAVERAHDVAQLCPQHPRGPRGVILEFGEGAVESLAHALQPDDELEHEHLSNRVVQEEDRRGQPFGETKRELSRGTIVSDRGGHQLGQATALSFAEKIMWSTVSP